MRSVKRGAMRGNVAPKRGLRNQAAGRRRCLTNPRGECERWSESEGQPSTSLRAPCFPHAPGWTLRDHNVAVDPDCGLVNQPRLHCLVTV